MALPSSHTSLKKTLRPKEKKYLQKKKPTKNLQHAPAGRCPSKINSWRHTRSLDLERDPLMYIIEERS